MEKTNFETWAGDDYTLSLDYDADITGWAVRFTLREEKASATYVLRKTVSSHTNASEGQTAITLTDTETAELAGTYYYDVEYTDASGNVKTTIAGVFTFLTK